MQLARGLQMDACHSNNDELLRKLQFEVLLFAGNERKSPNCPVNFSFHFLHLPKAKDQLLAWPSAIKKKNLENGSSVVRIFMDFVMALNVVCVLVDVAIKMQPVASIRKKKNRQGINCQLVKVNIYKCRK